MKSRVMLALSNSTRAQTLPKWEEKCFILFSGICLDRLPLQRSVICPWSYCLWDIELCHTYWQTGPWVVNLTGPASWLEGRLCIKLGLSICPGDPCQQLGWVSSHSTCSFAFKMWPSIFLGIPVFHCSMSGCWWWHCCSRKICSQLGERPSQLFCPTGRRTHQPLIGFFAHTRSSADQWFMQRSSSQQHLLQGNQGGSSLPVQEGRQTSLWWSSFAAWQCLLLFLMQRLSSCTCLFNLTSQQGAQNCGVEIAC